MQAVLERVRTRELDLAVIEDVIRPTRHGVALDLLFGQLREADVEPRAAARGGSEAPYDALSGFLTVERRRAMIARISWARRQMVRDGLVPCGRRFGYRSGGKAGRLVPHEAEAAIVRTIFDLTLEGVGDVGIARRLNEGHMLGDRGRPWTAGRIAGVIGCSLYRGVVVDGRYRYAADLVTGRRCRTPRPRNEWSIGYAPELAIVGAETWERAQERHRRGRRNAT